jgi:hypothetical protein
MQLNKRDKDFLDYFGTTTHLFAIIVHYARQFRDLMSQPLLLRKFIEGKGLTSAQNDNFTELIYLLQNTTDEYRKRGTLRVAEKAGSEEEINGELIRLINLIEPEEFIFALLGRENTGWCLGESSPTWFQTQNINNLTKGYEFTEDVLDLSKYPLVNASSVYTFEVGEKTGMIFSLYSSETGIKWNNDISKLIKVNHSIDYEISFRVLVKSGNGDNIKFGVDVFDANMNTITLQSINDGSYTNYFSGSGGKGLEPNQWYWFRGVLHKSDSSFLYQNNLNFRNGKGLKMDSDVKFIVPNITVDSAISTHETIIHDIKVRPLNLPFSQGIFGIKNIIVLYLKNSGQLSNRQLEKFISDKLISYSNNLSVKYLQ